MGANEPPTAERVAIWLYPNKIGLYERRAPDEPYTLIDQREVTPQPTSLAGTLSVAIPPEWGAVSMGMAWKVDPERTIAGIVRTHTACPPAPSP